MSLVVAGLVVWSALAVRRSTDARLPRTLALWMFALVVVQIALGGLNVVSRLSAVFVVPHLAVGAALWGASVWLWLSSRRLRTSEARLSAPDPGRKPGMTDTVRAYIALTKPRIIELLLVTTVPTMVLAQRGIPSIWLMASVVIGGTLAAGGANAINMYVDRDIDDLMRRTRHRPLPRHAVNPAGALWFGVALSVLAFAWLTLTVNLLSALLASSAIAFYVFVYTMWLKRTTPQNIVIGGAAGCVPVLVAWAAVTGEVGLPALVLFAIVFYWTPPHFWALALRYRGDYAAANVPMLPVVRGEAETARQIVLYTILLIAVSLLLLPAAGMGWVYLVAAVVLGGLFLGQALRLRTDAANGRAAISLFRYSITYLTLLFAAVAADALLRFPLRLSALHGRRRAVGRGHATWPPCPAERQRARRWPAGHSVHGPLGATRSSWRRSSWRIQSTTTTHRRHERQIADGPHDGPAQRLVVERRRAPAARVRDVMRVAGRPRRTSAPRRGTSSGAGRGRGRAGGPGAAGATVTDRRRPPATRRGVRRRGRWRAGGSGGPGSRAPGRTAR